MWGYSESKSDDKQTIGAPGTIVNVLSSPKTNDVISKDRTLTDNVREAPIFVSSCIVCNNT